MSAVLVDLPLWMAPEAEAATGGQLVMPGASVPGIEAAWSARGVSFDTRSLLPGDLFVAIEGARDGHDFLSAAQDAGAAAALVSRVPEGAPEGLPLLVVDDVMAGLHCLAEAARDRSFGKLVAVTGSVGKTSTKEMLRAALGTVDDVHAARASFNNHLGVPISLATLPSRDGFGVFEIGMNHAGEITPLVGLVQPHVAIITAIAPAHLAHFNSVDEIAAAKAEILTGVRRGGAAVLPADSPYFTYLAEEAAKAGVANLYAFGETASAEKGVRLHSYDEASGSVRVSVLGQEYAFTLAAKGKQHALNACAVIAAAHAIGADLPKVMDGLSGFTAGAGRGERLSLTLNGQALTVLDESYNANPASMRAALSVLKGTKTVGMARRIVVLGEMKELGEQGRALHADLAEPVVDAGTQIAFLAGKEMAALRDALSGSGVEVAAFADDASELLAPLRAGVRDGDVILFKGSNASGVSRLLSKFSEMCREGSVA